MNTDTSVATLNDLQQEILILVLLMTSNQEQASKLLCARFDFERTEGWFGKEMRSLSNKKITSGMLHHAYKQTILTLNKHRDKQIDHQIKSPQKMINKMEEALLNLEQEKKQGIQTKEVCFFQKIQNIIICMCSNTFEEVDEIETIMEGETKNRIEKTFFERVKVLEQYLSHETPLSQILIENPNSVFASLKYVKPRKVKAGEFNELNTQTISSNIDLRRMKETELMFVLLKTPNFATARELLLKHHQLKTTDPSLSKYIKQRFGHPLSYEMLRCWSAYVASVANPFGMPLSLKDGMTNAFGSIKQSFNQLQALKEKPEEEHKKFSFLQKISKIIVYMHCKNDKEIYSVQQSVNPLFHFHENEIDVNLFNEICSFKKKYGPYFLNQADSDIESEENADNQGINRVTPGLEAFQGVSQPNSIFPVLFWDTANGTRRKHSVEMMENADNLDLASKRSRKDNNSHQATTGVVHAVSLAKIDESLNFDFGFDFNEPFGHDTELVAATFQADPEADQAPFFYTSTINLSDPIAHTYNCDNNCFLQTSLLLDEMSADEKGKDENVHDLNRVTPIVESVQSNAISSGVLKPFWDSHSNSSSYKFEQEEGTLNEFESNKNKR